MADGTETARIVGLKKDDEVFFVIEYGSGDDGDGFFPSDYQSIDDMIEDMLPEFPQHITMRIGQTP